MKRISNTQLVTPERAAQLKLWQEQIAAVLRDL
jgi:hypothetical protein